MSHMQNRLPVAASDRLIMTCFLLWDGCLGPLTRFSFEAFFLQQIGIVTTGCPGKELACRGTQKCEQHNDLVHFFLLDRYMQSTIVACHNMSHCIGCGPMAAVWP